MTDGLTIDWEVADRIALASLVEHFRMTDQSICDHVNKERMLHPDDFLRYMRLRDCLQDVIEYYGGSV